MVELTKTIVTNKVAMMHQCNVASFYQSNGSLELLPLSRLWGQSRGIVLTVFGEVYDSADFINPRLELFGRLLEAPAAVLASSEHCARSFKQLGIARQVRAVYYGVDLKRFEDDGTLRVRERAKLGVTEADHLLLFLGRFEAEMGLDQLINMAPVLMTRAPSVKLILAGAKGPLVESALHLQRAYPDRVMVMNDVSFALQPSLYAASDLVLAPSRDQRACMGLAIKEAMAASRPVVGGDSGGIPEAIAHEETGLLVPLDEHGKVDQARFVEAVVSLLGDRQKRVEMGRKARLRAEHLFSEETTVRRIADVFIGVMPSA
jgi:glycosyltransferase involved in cell wall biosynthesis